MRHANWFKPNSWNSGDDQALKAALHDDLRRVSPMYVLPSALQRIRALHGAEARAGDAIPDAVLAQIGTEDVRWGPLVASTLPRMTPDDARVRWGGHLRPPLTPPGQPVRRDKTWTKAEKDVLRAAVSQHGTGAWAAVAAAVEGGRHPFECLSTWATGAHAVPQHKWGEEDDNTLMAALQEHLFAYHAASPTAGGGGERPSFFAGRGGAMGPDGLLGDGITGNTPLANWEWVSHCLPGRRVSALRARWELMLDPGIARQRFSPYEDARLVHLQAAFDSDWTAAAAHMPGRTPPQMRERWQNVLDPTVAKTPWTWGEVLALAAAVRLLGLSKWSAVSAKLQEQGIQRSDNQCWHKWRAMVREQPALAAVGEGGAAPEGDPSAPLVQARLKKATASSKVSAAHGRSAGVKHRRVQARVGGTVTALEPAVPAARLAAGGVKRTASQAAAPAGTPRVPPVQAKRGRAELHHALRQAAGDPGQLAAAVASAVQPPPLPVSAPPSSTESSDQTAALIAQRTSLPMPLSLYQLGQEVSQVGAGGVDSRLLLQAAGQVHAMARAAIRCSTGSPAIDPGDPLPPLTQLCTATVGGVQGAPGVTLPARRGTPAPDTLPNALPASLQPLWRAAQAAAAGDVSVQWMGATGVGHAAGSGPSVEGPPLGAALGAVCTVPGSALAAWITGRSAEPRPAAQFSPTTAQWWSALEAKLAEAVALQGGEQAQTPPPSLAPVRIAWLAHGTPVLVWQGQGPPPHGCTAKDVRVVACVEPPLNPPSLKRGDAPLASMHSLESWQLQRWSLVDALLTQHCAPVGVLSPQQAKEAEVQRSPPTNAHYPPSHVPVSGVPAWGAQPTGGAVDATQGAYEPALPLPPCGFLGGSRVLQLLNGYVPFSTMLSKQGFLIPCVPEEEHIPGSSRRAPQQSGSSPAGGAGDTDESGGGWSQSSDDGHARDQAVASPSPAKRSRPQRARRARQLDGAFMVFNDEVVGPNGELFDEL